MGDDNLQVYICLINSLLVSEYYSYEIIKKLNHAYMFILCPTNETNSLNSVTLSSVL
jgi:hypothetical protein